MAVIVHCYQSCATIGAREEQRPGTKDYATLPCHDRTRFKYIVIASEYFCLAHSNFSSKIMSFAMGLSRFSARNTLKTIFNPNIRRSLSTVCEQYEKFTSLFVCLNFTWSEWTHVFLYMVRYDTKIVVIIRCFRWIKAIMARHCENLACRSDLMRKYWIINFI